MMHKECAEEAAAICLEMIDKHGGERGLGLRCYDAIRRAAEGAETSAAPQAGNASPSGVESTERPAVAALPEEPWAVNDLRQSIQMSIGWYPSRNPVGEAIMVYIDALRAAAEQLQQENERLYHNYKVEIEGRADALRKWATAEADNAALREKLEGSKP